MKNVKYVLVETKAPDGYNQLTAPTAPITPTKVGAETKTTTWYVDEEGNVVDEQGKKTDVVYTDLTVGDNETPTTTLVVVNHSGAELPSTGGIGTTIFYAIGGVLMVGAAILFITKKRSTN